MINNLYAYGWHEQWLSIGMNKTVILNPPIGPSLVNSAVLVRTCAIALVLMTGTSLRAQTVSSIQATADPLALSMVDKVQAAAAVAASPDFSIQSKAQPLGLSIVDKVQTAGSDAASADFQKNVLPSVTNLINTNLKEYTNFTKANSFNLDPAKLLMSVDSTARVYFLGEGAGYRNTLGFNTLAPGTDMPKSSLTDSAQLIFPDASSAVSTYDPSSKVVRTASTPLLPGDFVDLGKFGAGTTLDFFLVANGAGGGKDVWSAQASRNRDNFPHVVAFAMPNSPYLIISFEDLAGGGDNDFNDVMFAVDIGAVNVQRLLSTPEPAAWMSILSLGLIAWAYRRRLAAA